MTKIVLGGGLSGLSAAYYLTKLHGKEKTLLLESSNRLGGWIRSEKVSKQVIFEQAPRTIRPSGLPGINTLNLLDELGLSAEIKPILKSSPAAKNRLIYANEALHLLPSSLSGLIIKQSPFSKPVLLQLCHDLKAEAKLCEDDTIYEFIKRRFGMEVADYLIDPLICGICAGNSKEISVKFLAKQLFAYEQQYGSVIKGVVRHLFDKNDSPKLSDLVKQSRLDKWSVYTFKNGIETLPIALQSELRSSGQVDVHLNSKCKEIQFNDNQSVDIFLEDGKTYQCSHLVSSIAAKNMALAIKKQHPQLAEKLDRIKTVSVGVINLLYEGDLIETPAFGFLVPPKEKLPILGVIYDSCCQNYKGCTVLTVMMGGSWFKDLFGDTPTEHFLLEIAKENVKKILNIGTEPVLAKVNILRDCIPQYLVGHEANLKDINEYIKAKMLPLSLCGASYYGVGVNDVILSAKNAIRNI